jgi:hypothetical protein
MVEIRAEKQHPAPDRPIAPVNTLVRALGGDRPSGVERKPRLRGVDVRAIEAASGSCVDDVGAVTAFIAGARGSRTRRLSRRPTAGRKAIPDLWTRG